MNILQNAAFESLKIKEFRFFLSIRFFATVAISIQFLVVEWKVYELTGNAIHLGLIGLAEIIPALGFSFISGHIVESKEKRNSLLWCILVSLAISIGFSFLLQNHVYQSVGQSTFLVAMYSLVFVWGTVRAFYTPSNFSLFSLVIPKKLYSNGSTWNASAWQIGAVIGPAIGGIIYSKIGATHTINYSTFLLFIALFCLLNISKKEIVHQVKEPIIQSLKKGFSFIFNQKIVLSALCLDLFAVLFGGAVALLPVFAKDILHTDAEGLGYLRAAPSVGAIITMISVAFFPINKKTGLKLLFCVFMFGVCIIIFGLSKWYLLSFVVLLFSGIFDGVSVIIRSTILQVLTPDDMRSRVSAVNSMFVGSSNELGAFESGLTAKWWGAVQAVVIGGSITLLVVLFTYFKSPEIKNFELDSIK